MKIAEYASFIREVTDALMDTYRGVLIIVNLM
jgi:hypothetical protein